MKYPAVYNYRSTDGSMRSAYLQLEGNMRTFGTLTDGAGPDWECPEISREQYMEDFNLTFDHIVNMVKAGHMHDRAIAIAMEMLL